MKNMKFPRAGELHRRAGRQAAQQDWPVGCTLRWAGGLHIKLGCGKGRAGGLSFSANPRPFPQPVGPPFCATRQPALQSFVQPARDDRIVIFYYPIPSCFWKMISVSDPNPVLLDIILSVSENYPKVYYDAQHMLLCFV